MKQRRFSLVFNLTTITELDAVSPSGTLCTQMLASWVSEHSRRHNARAGLAECVQ